IQNISFTYSQTQENYIFKNFNLNIEEGEIVTILGKSGCGKTTLLNLLTGKLQPQSGNITINKPDNVPFAFMPQLQRFIPFRTIFENACLPLELNKLLLNETLYNLKHLFNEFGLAGFENKYPNEISGGMRQRLGLIQNFATKTNVRIFDEPVISLDYNSVITLTDLIWNKIKTVKDTSIFVTHDLEFAINISDRLVILKPNSACSVFNLPNRFNQIKPSTRKGGIEYKNISTSLINELLY
ncbi:MAG: ATP-binding cassette domain-containing protein, partial [Sediminibacterium sp.]|nr:ATP-binding cassette domain-containing protein [Sediminibacterium sp.]